MIRFSTEAILFSMDIVKHNLEPSDESLSAINYVIQALGKVRDLSAVESERRFMGFLAEIKTALETIAKANQISETKRETAAEFFETLADIFLDESRDVNPYATSASGLF